MRTPHFSLETVTQKAETPSAAPDTSSETKKMTGFKSIDEVAAAAPSSASEIASPVRSTSSSAATAPKPAKRQTKAEKEKEEKDKAVEEAIAAIGTDMMKELAELPYEGWAALFADPALRLTPEESKKLADSYYLILKAVRPEQLTDWRLLLLFAGLQNTKIALGKLREHNRRLKEAKERRIIEGDIPSVSM